MKNIFRSKSKMFLVLSIMTSMVLGLSYAAFKVNSSSYRATNMMVSKLMYALNIREFNKSTSTISGNVITIPASTKGYYYVTISSINKIDSKYALAYASTNSVEVKYSSESESTPTEEIEGYTTTDTYSNTIKISIDNRNNSSSTTVTLNAFGGYTHNSYTSIIIDSGYTLIEGSYEEGKDINLISYTLNGNVTDISYDTLVNDYEVNSVTCENGSVATWDSSDKSLKFTNINVPEYCVIDFTEKPVTLASAILRDNPTVSERTDFSVTNVANTTGTIYKTNKTEDGSTVYYYSGNTTNNWVKFVGLYWRIIRTNEDDSVRLLYAGASHDTTSGYDGTSVFNSSYSESRYVGYMYGDSTSLADSRNNTSSSDIKTFLDDYYQHMLTDYDKYISKTAIYCNDRSVSTGTWSNSGTKMFYYGGYARLFSNKTPTYKCGGNTSGGLFESTQAIEDKFSASTEGGGNGQLQNPIALMTADEVAFAGGKMGSSLSSPYAYYATNSLGESITGSTNWWLMTPYYWEGSGRVSLFFVKGSSSTSVGLISSAYASVSYAVRPVISISNCAKVTGTGTSTDPYKIDAVNSTCVVDSGTWLPETH